MERKIRQSPKLPAETRRQQLLESARRLFIKKGYRITTTEEIARNAGLTKGALYFHFKSKEDILFEVIKGMSGKTGHHFDENLRQARNLTDFFKMLMAAHENVNCRDHWEMAEIWVQGMKIPRIKRFLCERLEQLVEDVVRHLRPAHDCSRAELRQLVLFVFAVHHGLAFVDTVAPRARNMKTQVKFVDRLSKTVRRDRKMTNRTT